MSVGEIDLAIDRRLSEICGLLPMLRCSHRSMCPSNEGRSWKETSKNPNSAIGISRI